MKSVGWIKARFTEVLTATTASLIRTDIVRTHVPIAKEKLIKRGPICILVPHPDDEIIGCFHLIERLGRIIPIDLIYVTDGAAGGSGPTASLTERRRRESDRATSGLPIRRKEWWMLPDGFLGTRRVDLCRRLALLESSAEYGTILCPARTDPTSDHAILAETVLDTFHPRCLLWYRSTWMTFPLSAADYIVSGDAKEKIKALRCFSSQDSLAMKNVVILSSIEARRHGYGAKSVEAFRSAEEGAVNWTPINALSMRAIRQIMGWN